MISTNDFRKGTKIEFKGEPYEVIDFQHVKMGRGGAFIRTKMKGLRTGKVIEETFTAGDKLPKAPLEEKEMQYLYNQDKLYYFMDTGTFEQIPLNEEQLSDAIKLLKENMKVNILYYKNEPMSIELPTFVELQVTETEPGFKGDTASGGSKPAKVETGAVVKVPFHINEDDIIKIDTRTVEYIERVKQ
ncbi:elongation factor P [bacterium BMS3Abin07]|nr:elongation factor P [bacterium BMS3Abin07]GBE33461.1 elongation factor P [bacterium BMS3Bbin05]HDO22743.1 elongation factor P [Nitrospirota bacterium]HDZ88239.1 elongation factor P [Nitrospirota bacterium]